MARYGTLAGILALIGVLGYLYYSVVAGLVAQWLIDTTYGYGFYIPPVAAYLVWERRHRLRMEPDRSSWWGYVLFLGGLLVLIAARAGGISLMARGSLIIVLLGLALFLTGWRTTKLLAFPIVFLAFMIPIPITILYRLTWPLQIFTARFSTEVLRLAGYPVLLHGIYIDLPSIRLEVAAACSGFRSLVALGATGVLLSYLTQDRWINRVALVAAVVPIAILANAVRVTSNILLGMYEGTYHAVAGWMVFVIATAVLLGIGSLMAQKHPRALA
jgi:exosortase